MENLEQFFKDNQRGYPRDPRRMAYAKLQKNTQGMDREQLEAFIKANLFIPHSQYKMALGNLIQFLKKQDQMGSLNEVKQFQKLAGLLKETWHPDKEWDEEDDQEETGEDYPSDEELFGLSEDDYSEDPSSDMDDESQSGDTDVMGIDEGKVVSIDSIDFSDEGNRDDIFTLEASDEDIENFEEGNVEIVFEDDEYGGTFGVYKLPTGEYMYAFPDAEFYTKAPKGIKIKGVGLDEAKKKGTLDNKEEIGEKLQSAVKDYLESIGLREISKEEKPKFQKGLGRTQTTIPDTFVSKVGVNFHYMTSDDDPRREDPRHDDQEVTYGLRIYKPNEKFNISTLRGFIQQAKREAQAEGFRFLDTVRRSNQDILVGIIIR